ncbi:hypothetical protein JKP88DRAFT_236637 [Tribonema minus]|uniref:Uncharacterized protein n=1 Tax=Tribonema minus TaxID=303371 RepID=A0A835Z143_9STRA|nr:hypothetical protein JKP88DRAFT_236637 [Tribonema minus]
MARAISKRVLQLSLLLGLGLAGASQVITPWALPFVCKSNEVVRLVQAVFPMALTGFPICCMVWTWDSLFYGASDFLYNARTIAVASAIGAAGILASLKWNFGLAGLWLSMTYLYFCPRLYAHYRRFNDSRGPFGKSTADLKLHASGAASS